MYFWTVTTREKKIPAITCYDNCKKFIRKTDNFKSLAQKHVTMSELTDSENFAHL
jgi:hypothetical protein